MAYTKQAKKHAGRERKEQIVAELIEKLDNSSGVVFADYQGLTHQQLENLKKELKKLDSTIVIAKNSLLKLSLEKSKNFGSFKDNEGLNLPTATLFIQGDMVEPLKKLQKLVKELDLPKIKFGVLEGNLTDEAGVLKIASLPNREALITQFVGTLNSPIQGLVVALNANISKFVMTLNAVAQSKPTEPVAQPGTVSEQTTETAEAPAAETPTEEAVPANQPAEQPEAPVETDESADTDTDAQPAEEISKQPEETKTNDEKSEGGEN